MKKFFTATALSILLLTACGEGETENQVIEQEQQEEVKEKPVNFKVDVNEEMDFNLFDVVVKSARVYEKDDSLLADIKIEWTNKDYQYGEEKTFFVSTQFNVKQGEQELEEINDAWNVENKNSSDVFFPNAAGGKWFVDLTYELTDVETPLNIEFTPTTETEETETITVNLTE